MRRATRLVSLCVAVAVATLTSAGVARAAPTDYPPIFNGDGTVTFRYYAPDATTVQLRGEWDATIAPPISWPLRDMTKDPATGVWSTRQTLTNGLYAYTFIVNGGPLPYGVIDPSNPPWEADEARSSQVYVPATNSPGATEYFGWLADKPDVPHGKLTLVKYGTPTSAGKYADGNHPAVVYTPPGYDPASTRKYPTLYILHGANENHLEWSIQGRINFVEDNLLAAGLAQPIVIVMLDWYNTPQTCCPFNAGQSGQSTFQADFKNYIEPYVEAHYNVLGDRYGRALAGLSAGGGISTSFLAQSPGTFGYFGLMSPAASSPTVAQLSTPDAQSLLGVYEGAGNADEFSFFNNVRTENTRLNQVGIPNRLHITPDDVPAGFASPTPFQPLSKHAWAVWRELGRDMLTNTLFRATKTAVQVAGTKVTATVAAATTEPAVPTGTVVFSAGATPISGPIALQNGTATFDVPNTAGAASVNVTYSGDKLYNASTGTTAFESTTVNGSAGGTVPATLSLTLGSSPSFGAFTPGVDKTYTTSTIANVISSAGDATLSVADPGHLTNGAFSLPEALQVTPSKTTWSAPVSNDPVTIAFSQHIGADDALRTGTYSTTVTLTLSTTTP